MLSKLGVYEMDESRMEIYFEAGGIRFKYTKPRREDWIRTPRAVQSVIVNGYETLLIRDCTLDVCCASLYSHDPS